MRQHPILFSREMIEAIFAKRKTQTRRLAGLEKINQEPERYEYMGETGDVDVPMYAFRDKQADGVLVRCPYGGAGHLLWVREAWQAQNVSGRWWHEVRREDRDQFNWAFTNPVKPAYEAIPPRWLPGIHMPRMACRLHLPVARIVPERLHMMTLDKMEKEGVREVKDDRHPLSPFIDLWDRLNGNWDLNPWVWAVEFDQ